MVHVYPRVPGRIFDIWAFALGAWAVLFKVYYAQALLEKSGGCFELLQRWQILWPNLTGTSPVRWRISLGYVLSIIYGLLEDECTRRWPHRTRKEDAA